MVSATSCDDDMAKYHLCSKLPELISSDKACYYLKKGKSMKIQQIQGVTILWSLVFFGNINILINVIVLHCHDGIKTGDETGVDCGGSCEACQGMHYQVYNNIRSLYIVTLKLVDLEN